MAKRIPQYSLHKGSGQACVSVSEKGKTRRIYLGKYDSAESRQKYAEFLAEWVNREPDQHVPRCSNDHLAILYLEHARSYYVDSSGQPTGETPRIQAALRYVVKEFGPEQAAQFGPKKLKFLRNRMIAAGLSRNYINSLVSCIKRAFRWAVAEELIPPSVYQSLAAVDGLKRGRSKARESAPVKPVTDADVDRTLPFVSSQVRAMVNLQRYTGMRPGEVLIIRPCDLEFRDDGLWTYQPSRHKTDFRGISRTIVIGKRGQQWLEPWLERDQESHCFRPCEASAYFRNTRGPGDLYHRASYRNAILRACKKAEISPAWSPNQLRHLYATKVRQRFGLEAAQVTLGHANAEITEIYADRDQRLALRVQLEIG